MQLRRYWRVFKRRAWIPLLLVLASGLAVGTVSVLSKPEYVATATVEARVTTTGGAAAPTQILSLPEVLTSNTLALAVIRDLQLPLEPAQLKARLRVSAGRSDLYTISITDPSPEQAVAIVDSAAKQAIEIYQAKNALADTAVFDARVATQRKIFLQRYHDAERALLQYQADHPNLKNSSDIDQQATYQDLLLDQQAAAAAYQSFSASTTATVVNAISEATHFTASVLDPAIARPDLRIRYLRVAYAAGLALAIGLVLIVVLEYLDSSLREPESVEAMMGLPVVGIIPQITSQSLRQRRGGTA